MGPGAYPGPGPIGVTGAMGCPIAGCAAVEGENVGRTGAGGLADG